MICFKSIGSSVLAMSLVFGDKVIMLDLSKWHKSNRYGFLTHRQKWHSLNRNAWHNETEITGTNRTEVTTNGIAIGPAISDLISEIVLSSVDTDASKIIDAKNIDFIGVRFKDDYRFL